MVTISIFGIFIFNYIWNILLHFILLILYLKYEVYMSDIFCGAWCLVKFLQVWEGARDVAVREGKQWALLALYLEYFSLKYLRYKGEIWGGK